MSAPTRIHLNARIGPEAFRRLCARNPELRLERSSKGALEIMTPAGTGSAGRNALITARLVAWADATGLGKAFDSSAGFTLPNGAIRSPDASWVSNARWEALSVEERETGFAPLRPEFVAELRSPSDSAVVLRRKMREYLSQGARLGWLIDVPARRVEIYRPESLVERLTEPRSLSGEDVLPGFTLDLVGILID